MWTLTIFRLYFKLFLWENWLQIAHRKSKKKIVPWDVHGHHNSSPTCVATHTIPASGTCIFPRHWKSSELDVTTSIIDAIRIVVLVLSAVLCDAPIPIYWMGQIISIFLRKSLQTKCLWIELVRNTIAWCLVPGTGRDIKSARYNKFILGRQLCEPCIFEQCVECGLGQEAWMLKRVSILFCSFQTDWAN